jgi:cell division protein YceG involved in septum cleavage
VSDFGEWQDPFAEDERARDRDRRRAERDARRRESLGEKVSNRQESTPPTPPTPPPTEPPGPPAPATAPAQPPPEPGPPGGPPSDRDLMVRRAIAAVGILVLLFVVWFVGDKVRDVIGGLGGDDAPAQEQTVKVEDLVIPEGQDRHQVAALAKDAGLEGDYEEATERAPKGFPIDEYAPDGAPDLEGFLFPDTYNLEKNAKVETLVQLQLDRFEELIGEVDLSYAKSKNLNTYDVLKIASMIEREIMHDDERRLAAAVIYNRLAAGDTLGIDATIRFEDQNWDEQLTLSRLDQDTPYNTRTNAGLPPTPIGNPGLASIEAAANPARSDVYYFVVEPGTCGEHVFVETEEEFAAAEAEYQQALEAEGGSPTDC